MKEKKNESYNKSYDTDATAKTIWLKLLGDFRASEGPDFGSSAESCFLNGRSSFREYQFPEHSIANVENVGKPVIRHSICRFKRYHQLKNLLKKYRFADDMFSDSDLVSSTLRKFFEEQEIFATHKPMSLLGHRVLQAARKHAKRILGPYSPEDTVIGGRFGRKSSIGCPLSLAYIDHKLTDAKAFTSSSECAKWFWNEVLPEDSILSALVAALGVNPGTCSSLSHESLNLVVVPKSWKSYRPITPLTLLALFYSYGVGEQVTSCLKAEGLNLATLQNRHRRLIEKYSIDLTHATADLSSASQSLTSVLLNQILPREWYCAVKKTFSHELLIEDGDRKTTSCYTESVLPMGNGLTFPVETLVFYVVLKAIAELSKVKGVISVYGDDLIYPSGMHKYVVHIFSELKFMLNSDKTFVKAPFRESCGSDFYCGTDVRPAFIPEGGQLTRSKYCAWLYKTYNSLTRRWDELEIRSTLYYLLTEMAQLGYNLYRVPPSYPDSAGIKVSSPEVIPLDTHLLPWEPVKMLITAGSRWYSFSFLAELPDKRVVVSVLPYYWQALHGQTDSLEKDNFWETDYSALHIPPAQTSLIWEKLKRRRTVLIRGKRKTVVSVSFSPKCSVKNFTRSTITTVPLPTGIRRPGETGPNSDWT